MSSTNENRGVARYPLPGVPTPILAADIANKAYVDLIRGFANSEIKSADQSVVSSTVLVDCDDLEFPIVNGRTYFWEAHLLVESGGVPDAKVSARFQSGAGTGLWGFISTGFTQTNAYGAGVSGISATWPQYFTIKGAFLCTGNGVLAIQFAQVTSDALATSILASSFLKWSETP